MNYSFMKSTCCNADTYYQLWFCDKNPKGLLNNPKPHGNEIDGVTTCEDDYCRPNTKIIGYPSDYFLNTHECVEKCTECGNIIDHSLRLYRGCTEGD